MVELINSVNVLVAVVVNKLKLQPIDVLKKALISAFFYIFSLVALQAKDLQSMDVAPCFPLTGGQEVVVSGIIDGDTFSLADGRIVKILGMEAPELNFQEPSYSENGAVKARDFLQQLLADDEPIKIFLDDKKQDRYGRILAYVLRVRDQLDVGAHILKQGWARQVIYPPNQIAWQCYQKLELMAQKQQLGIWTYLRYWSRITHFVDKSDAGYLRLQGEITSSKRNRRYIWLMLDNKISLGIKLDDLHYFPEGFSRQLLHKQVDIRGWLYFSNDKLRIRIRHPQQLILIN